jgi:hypothetical protein
LDQVIGARRRARGRKYAMARRTKKPLPHDPYWDVVQSLMQNILTIYEAYRDKKPVMLFDMQEHRIYVYPYLEFKNDVSERSQRLLQDQYEQLKSGHLL